MSSDPKPIRKDKPVSHGPEKPSANPALLPLELLAEADRPLALAGAMDVAALFLEVPSLDSSPQEGQGAPAAPQPVLDIDTHTAGSSTPESGSLVDRKAHVSASQENGGAGNSLASISQVLADHQVGGLDANPGALRELLARSQTESGLPSKIARYELANAALPDKPAPGPLWDSTSRSKSLAATPAEEDLQAPTGPAIDELMVRAGENTLALADHASLFAGSGDSPGNPRLMSGEGPNSASATRLEFGWSAGELPGAEWQAFNRRDDPQVIPSIGSTTDSGSVTDALSSEMIGELASRLLSAAERLEQTALRLRQPGPETLVLQPRPFRGRVDG